MLGGTVLDEIHGIGTEINGILTGRNFGDSLLKIPLISSRIRGIW
jgi:hypothetical protein